jgi:bifunctional pyridoxal-dependent enzyme with beta-cystathionase and maltose regulon repressor activities
MTTTEATDFDIARLRARRTNKWHKFPPDVLPAWVADMDFGVAPSITAALARLTRDQEYGYAARDGVLAAAFVRRMERRFGWHTDPADTIAIGDLVQACFSSVMAFSEPGDAILLQLPSYPPFMRAIEDTGRRLIANPMRDDGTRWALDLGAYEAARDPRLRMLIFRRTPPGAPSPGQNWRRLRNSRSGMIWWWCPTRSTRTSSIPATRTSRSLRCIRRSRRAPSPSPRRPRVSISRLCAAPSCILARPL